VRYPVDCEEVGWRVWDVAYAEPAESHAVALVLVTCNAGAGTPSVELYAFDRTGRSSPRLSQTLVSAADNWQANHIEVHSDSVSLPVFGFSSVDVPRCCPDVTATLAWRWNGSAYDSTDAGPDHHRW